MITQRNEAIQEVKNLFQRLCPSATSEGHSATVPEGVGSSAAEHSPPDAQTSHGGGTTGGNSGNNNGGGSGGNSGGQFWRSFFAGVTFMQVVFAIIAFIAASASYKYATNDTPDNRAHNEGLYHQVQIELAKARQMEAMANGHSSSVLPSLVSTPPAQQYPCDFPIKPNDGSWSLSKGKCFTVDNSKDEVKNQPFGIGGETAIVSVTGGDFTVITADESREGCDSRQSTDRCSMWMREHSTSDRNGRHWFLFTLPSQQKISINTAQ